MYPLFIFLNKYVVILTHCLDKWPEKYYTSEVLFHIQIVKFAVIIFYFSFLKNKHLRSDRPMLYCFEIPLLWMSVLGKYHVTQIDVVLTIHVCYLICEFFENLFIMRGFSLVAFVEKLIFYYYSGPYESRVEEKGQYRNLL